MLGEQLRSLLLGTIGLWLILVVAVVLTLIRPGISTDRILRAQFRWLLVVAIVVQVIHFIEELATSFHCQFPELLGLVPWTMSSFALFNITWICIWIAAAIGVDRGYQAALAPVWFLALALVFNGVGHPLLALIAEGYFPGLYTSPLVGITGLLLASKLLKLTSGTGQARGENELLAEG